MKPGALVAFGALLVTVSVWGCNVAAHEGPHMPPLEDLRRTKEVPEAILAAAGIDPVEHLGYGRSVDMTTIEEARRFRTSRGDIVVLTHPISRRLYPCPMPPRLSLAGITNIQRHEPMSAWLGNKLVAWCPVDGWWFLADMGTERGIWLFEVDDGGPIGSPLRFSATWAARPGGRAYDLECLNAFRLEYQGQWLRYRIRPIGSLAMGGELRLALWVHTGLRCQQVAQLIYDHERPALGRLRLFKADPNDKNIQSTFGKDMGPRGLRAAPTASPQRGAPSRPATSPAIPTGPPPTNGSTPSTTRPAIPTGLREGSAW